jgi:hypothetical protein
VREQWSFANDAIRGEDGFTSGAANDNLEYLAILSGESRNSNV